MSVFTRWTLGLAAALALLLADGVRAEHRSEAACRPGAAHPAEARIGEDAGTRVARRRKKRRRRKRRRRPAPKPKPKPAPAPAPAAEPAGAPAAGGASGLRRTSRIEFDAQLIKGQTTKAGEVQILERKDTELKSMVKRRTSFRKEIIHTVFPDK